MRQGAKLNAEELRNNEARGEKIPFGASPLSSVPPCRAFARQPNGLSGKVAREIPLFV